MSPSLIRELDSRRVRRRSLGLRGRPRPRRLEQRCVVSLLAFASLVVPPAASAADNEPAYVASIVRDFVYDAEPPMQLPTDVAVSGDGSVFVADGVHDRVLVFAPNGTVRGVIKKIGTGALARPTGLTTDRDGNVWIADTGNRRVVQCRSDGEPIRIIELSEHSSEHDFDATDIALSKDERVLWIVDNDNHRLVRMDLETQRTSHFGSKGLSPSQFHYPYMTAIGSMGDVLVTDVINGRVQKVGETGQFTGSLGSYGLDLGQLYRPKGIAVDTDGNVWISDNVLGVIQVFTAAGVFVDVLRNAERQPLELNAPVGLAFDSEGMLYVVELKPSRVRKLRIRANSGAARVERVAVPSRVNRQPRTCTACHLEWIPPLDKQLGTELIAVPDNSPTHPAVSRSDRCLSCHDGSVVDSRRAVWVEHSHVTDVAPSQAVHIPRDFPLADGQVVCRTCHAAHQREVPITTLRNAVSFRAEEAGELCIRCHQDAVGDPLSGVHPAGETTIPCLTCHTPHGASNEDLSPESMFGAQLCLSCHEHISPDFAESSWIHPLDPPLNAAQLAGVALHKGRVTASNELTCGSCHKMHHAKEKRGLLAESLDESRLCASCHEHKVETLSGAHDFRVGLRATEGLDPETSATHKCGFCHSIHSAPAPFLPSATASARSPVDWMCMGCHGNDTTTTAPPARRLLHPSFATGDHGNVVSHSSTPLFGKDGHRSDSGAVACATCHDPHAASERSPALLRSVGDSDGSSLCKACHPEAESLATSVHNPSFVHSVAGEKHQCGPCHSVHAPTPEWTGGMWAGALADSSGPMTVRRCRGCHSSTGPAVGVPELSHPALPMTNTPDPGDAGYLPLHFAGDETASGGRIVCITCHLPHGRDMTDAWPSHVEDTPPALVRAAKPMLRPYIAPNLCSSCHGFDGLRRWLRFHSFSQTEAGR